MWFSISGREIPCPNIDSRTKRRRIPQIHGNEVELSLVVSTVARKSSSLPKARSVCVAPALTRPRSLLTTLQCRRVFTSSVDIEASSTHRKYIGLGKEQMLVGAFMETGAIGSCVRSRKGCNKQLKRYYYRIHRRPNGRSANT